MENKKEAENKVADALSRRNEMEEDISDGPNCRVTSIVELAWLEKVKDMMTRSPYFQELQKKADNGNFVHHPIQEVGRSIA